MTQFRREHWSEVYETKAADSVSWYQPKPAPSLRALEEFGAQPDSAVIDVGGGASGLAGALLERGWREVTVLDIAEPALRTARTKLGPLGEELQWIVADITRWRPRGRYDVWHDRAVFHFLTQADQREAYRRALLEGTAPDALVVIATFAPDGPERCSGLPVRRYDPQQLSEELGPGLRLIRGWGEFHTTPSGAAQSFNWCAFRRAG